MKNEKETLIYLNKLIKTIDKELEEIEQECWLESLSDLLESAQGKAEAMRNDLELLIEHEDDDECNILSL